MAVHVGCGSGAQRSAAQQDLPRWLPLPHQIAPHEHVVSRFNRNICAAAHRNAHICRGMCRQPWLAVEPGQFSSAAWLARLPLARSLAHANRNAWPRTCLRQRRRVVDSIAHHGHATRPRPLLQLPDLGNLASGHDLGCNIGPNRLLTSGAWSIVSWLLTSGAEQQCSMRRL